MPRSRSERRRVRPTAHLLTRLVVVLGLSLAALAPALADERAPTDAEAGSDGNAQVEGEQTSPNAQMTEAERDLLTRGEYTGGEIAASGLLGTIIGFGTGHAVQDRYRESGWIYTVGEGTGLVILGIGIPACGEADDFFDNAGCIVGVAITGEVLFLGFKLVEIVDVWAHPAIHNRRVRALEERTVGSQWSFQVRPHADGGMTAGLALRY